MVSNKKNSIFATYADGKLDLLSAQVGGVFKPLFIGTGNQYFSDQEFRLKPTALLEPLHPFAPEKTDDLVANIDPSNGEVFLTNASKGNTRSFVPQ